MIKVNTLFTIACERIRWQGFLAGGYGSKVKSIHRITDSKGEAIHLVVNAWIDYLLEEVSMA